MDLYPVIGCGALPFRGGLYPLRPERFLHEYKGIRTVTIQSAFRYDYPKNTVIKAIKVLNAGLPKGQAADITPQDEEKLIKLIKPFEAAYRRSVEQIAPLINDLAKALPKRRERVQHIGLFGYSRGHGKVSLPRAISFTAVMYSLGIPPELIGTGRGLAAARKAGQLHLVEKYYINLKHDMYFAGKFLYKPGLVNLAKRFPAWKNILLDVEEIEKYLGKPLAAKYLNEQEHQLISAKIHKQLKNGKHLTTLIEQAAILRHSMG
jgi:phosphoenolpyruvate carboxylase